MSTDRATDAFLYARKIAPGCDHIAIYCKCDTPYWLRESSPSERAREKAMCPPEVLSHDPAQQKANGTIPESAMLDLPWSRDGFDTKHK